MPNKNASVIILGLLGVLLLGYLIGRFSYVLQSADSVASLVWYLILLCAFVPYLVSRFRTDQILRYGGVWVGIFIVLLIGYAFQEEIETAANKIKSNLYPYSPSQKGNGYIEFTRAADGHFHVEATINGIPVRFLLDTGATRTVLTLEDAKRIGYDVDSLSYGQPVQTAKGLDFVAPIRIDAMRIGDQIIHDIPVSVSKNLTDSSLLGMSFLKKLKEFKVEGNYLTVKIF